MALVHAFDKRGGGGEAKVTRDPVHRRYTTCERKGRVQGRWPAALVVAWPEIAGQAADK